jgi:threonine/homoserine/homoserine lactone efflux protein
MPEEQQLLARTGRESRRAGWIVLVGLTVATLAMATASHWGLVL